MNPKKSVNLKLNRAQLGTWTFTLLEFLRPRGTKTFTLLEFLRSQGAKTFTLPPIRNTRSNQAVAASTAFEAHHWLT
ncbi:hypothetical protein PGTUg99_013408 [Puccinia graminis f. sp. tritici]|uniref:Uncharacterized protein n=1 Tax=Puccinia graminis f. sp. tritici TaxID=56615 RepID=A0A5B0Q148_PUCGR|nr:hypothetical protein PGTUg99_013408 [Puccinia graminis f. sp. tritici]